MNAPEPSDTARPSGELSSNRAAITHAHGGDGGWVGRGGGDFFISSFSGRATGESALNPSVVLLTFNVLMNPRVRAAD